MAKIDVSAIEGYEEMSAEEKLAAYRARYDLLSDTLTAIQSAEQSLIFLKQ